MPESILKNYQIIYLNAEFLQGKVNILLNVGFNREVAKDGAVYWSKEEGSLSSVIDKVDHYDAAEIEALHAKAKKRIEERFNWDYIVDKYERIFNVR